MRMSLDHCAHEVDFIYLVQKYDTSEAVRFTNILGAVNSFIESRARCRKRILFDTAVKSPFSQMKYLKLFPKYFEKLNGCLLTIVQ